MPAIKIPIIKITNDSSIKEKALFESGFDIFEVVKLNFKYLKIDLKGITTKVQFQAFSRIINILKHKYA